jgi:hypothetical protein
MKGNFISLNRKILYWRWYNRPNTFRLFVHILLKANYKDKEWENMMIKRGTFVTSIAKLSTELGLSPKKIRTSIRHLTETKEVTIKANRKHTLITVNKYDSYQFTEEEGEQGANLGQTEGKQRATTNNINNLNKEINTSSLPKLLDDQLYTEHLAMSSGKKIREIQMIMREYVKFLKDSGEEKIEFKRAKRSFAGFVRSYKPKGTSKHNDITM